MKNDNKNEEMITITKQEYDGLLKSQFFLECLEACGIDNWGGYSDAHDLMEELEEQERKNEN